MGGCNGQRLGRLYKKISPACKNCYAGQTRPCAAMESVGEALQVEPSADGKRRLKMWGARGFPIRDDELGSAATGVESEGKSGVI